MNSSENAQMSPESPFQSHLKTNYIPTDPEISQIRAHLLPHEAEVARLDALIQDLCAQRERMKDYVDSHRALISHPRRLPQEILEEIFIACLPTAHNAVMSSTEPPLLLGRICSRWRSIAFALPRLWSSLHVHLGYACLYEERVAAIDEWLNRASPSPLSISIRGSDAYGLGFYDEAVVDILTRLSSYWSTLCFYKPSKSALRSLAAEDAPALSDVEIHFRDDFEEDPERPFLGSRFLLGQKQCHISVVAVNPPFFVPTTRFTWSHITELSFKRADSSHSYHDAEEGYFDMDTAHRLIEGCPRLSSLQIPISVGVAEPEIEPLKLPFLEVLSIRNDSTTSEVFHNFIDNLVMPQLTRFQLVNTPRYLYSNPVELSVFERFTGRSPLLSEILLELPSCSSTVDALCGLRHLARISKLSIVLWTPGNHGFITDYDEDELFAVIAAGSPSNPVPALRDFSLETRFIPDETWMQFLRGHIDHRTSLSRVRLRLWVDSPDDIPTVDLGEFVDAGLVVSVDYEVDEDLFRATPWGGIDRREQ